MRYDDGVSNRLPQAFGQVLCHHREAKGWSQMTLATKAGLHLNAVGHLERGQRSPSLKTVFALCRALEIPVTKFFAALEKRHPEL